MNDSIPEHGKGERHQRLEGRWQPPLSVEEHPESWREKDWGGSACLGGCCVTSEASSSDSGMVVCVCVCVCVRAHVCMRAQSCSTLCNPMDCSPLGSSVHGIFQGRILEWGATLSSPGIEPGFPALQADSLLSEPPGKLIYRYRYIHTYLTFKESG